MLLIQAHRRDTVPIDDHTTLGRALQFNRTGARIMMKILNSIYGFNKESGAATMSATFWTGQVISSKDLMSSPPYRLSLSVESKGLANLSREDFSAISSALKDLLWDQLMASLKSTPVS